MKLRAKVRKVTGRTKIFVSGIECTDFAYVEIEDLKERNYTLWYLYRYNHDCQIVTDTVHESLEEAQQQANYEFEINQQDWETVS